MPPPDLQQQFSSVVKLEVTGASVDWLQPWRVNSQKEWGGSGFAIPGRRILTNHHVVDEATDIRIRKNGSSRRFRATALCSSAELDLAVVEIVDDDVDLFWEGVKVVTMAPDLPSLQERVTVVGFPTGGNTVCVTEGVISRVDCKNYNISNSSKHSSGNLLVVQIDAAINPGNSGGPCFDHQGHVTGVAFQGLSADNVDNIGYMVPATLVECFLHGIDDNGGYAGVPQVPFAWHNLHNKSLRKLLKVPKDMTGVVVTDAAPLARTTSGAQLFQHDDVIFAIDGHELGDDFTVSLRGECAKELVHAAFLITGKRPVELTSFSVFRNAKRIQLKARLGPLPPPLPRFPGVNDPWGFRPSWVIIGGLVFVPLSCPMLGSTRKAWSAIWKLGGGPSATIQEKINNPGFVAAGDEELQCVVLIQILKAELNYGYQVKRWSCLKTLNGEAVQSIAQLQQLFTQAVDSKATWLQFEFVEGGKIVLDTSDCMKTNQELLAAHKISASFEPTEVANDADAEGNSHKSSAPLITDSSTAAGAPPDAKRRKTRGERVGYKV